MRTSSKLLLAKAIVFCKIIGESKNLNFLFSGFYLGYLEANFFTLLIIVPFDTSNFSTFI
jgi:hypothetical protein